MIILRSFFGQEIRRGTIQAIIHLPGFEISAIYHTTELLTISAISLSTQAMCPACQQLTSTTHGYHTRNPQDLPSDGKTLVLKLRVRRFRCSNPGCCKQTFVERLPDWLPSYSRWTKRVIKLIQLVGLEAGGEAGNRLLAYFKVRISGDTVVRMLRRTSDRPIAPPRVIGVDDWAFRKGQTYGTIIVDLEARRVIDLLPDRQVDTLQSWLEAHPTIEYVSRDRSTEYASAIAAGCPQAIQVADRWHLLANVREVVEKYLKSIDAELKPFAVPPAKVPLFIRQRPPFRRAQSDKLRGAASHQRRHDLYQQIQHFRQEGLSIRQIAHALGLHRNTVKKYYDAKTCPVPKQQKQMRSILDPYVAYLTSRQRAGCENAMQLWREIVALGYPGSHRQVQRWLQQCRVQPAPNTPKMYLRTYLELEPLQQARLPTLRELSWLMTKAPMSLIEREHIVLAYLVSHSPVALVYSLIQQFITMVKEKQPAQLTDWLQKMQDPISHYW